jgi:hypothetical protein
MYYSLNYYHSISINHTLIPGDVTDGTIILTQVAFNNDIKTTGGSKSPRSDGGDIRFFTDSALNTPLPFDIINFTQNATPANARIEINVKISLSSASDTTFYVGWGNASLTALPRTDTYGRNNAYKSGFKLWCPMRDDPTNDLVQDRTINDLTGFKQGANNPAQLVDAGVLNEAEVFVAANNSYIQFTTINTGTQFTVFPPFYYTGAATHGYQRIVSNKTVWNAATGFEINLFLNSSTQAQIHGANASEWNPAVFTNIVTDGWENFAVRFNGTNVDIFNTGVKTSGVGVITSVANTANNITIGDNAALNEALLDARVDPIIIYVGVLTDAEVQTMQANQRSPATFVSAVGSTHGNGPFWNSNTFFNAKRRYTRG